MVHEVSSVRSKLSLFTTVVPSVVLRDVNHDLAIRRFVTPFEGVTGITSIYQLQWDLRQFWDHS